MLRFRFVISLAWVFLTTAAAAQTAKPKPLTLAAAKTLLPGTWQATDDPRSLLVITPTQYIERYKGEPDALHALKVQNRPCGETLGGGKPSGDLFLDTDDVCYFLITVNATRLELSPVGGRGNTLAYRRAAAKK